MYLTPPARRQALRRATSIRRHTIHVWYTSAVGRDQQPAVGRPQRVSFHERACAHALQVLAPQVPDIDGWLPVPNLHRDASAVG